MPIPLTTLHDSESDNSDIDSICSYFQPQTEVDKEPNHTVQNNINDLVRDLTLPKSQSELLASPLKDGNLLAKATKVAVYRKRTLELATFLSMQENFCFCNDVLPIS